MTAREINPQLRTVAYNGYLHKGLCPNTGAPCENVAALVMRYSAARDSMPLAGDSRLPQGQATTEKFYQTSDEVHRTFDRSLVDTEACLGGCAIVAAEDQQTIPQPPEQ